NCPRLTRSFEMQRGGPVRPPLFFSELFGLLGFARGFGFGMLMKMFEAEAVLHRLPMVETANDIVHVLVRLVLEGVRHSAKEIRHRSRVAVVHAIEHFLFVQLARVHWRPANTDLGNQAAQVAAPTSVTFSADLS